jgi:hypothetical protein
MKAYQTIEEAKKACFRRAQGSGMGWGVWKEEEGFVLGNDEDAETFFFGQNPLYWAEPA